LYLGRTEVIFPKVVIGIGMDDYDAGFLVCAVSDYQPWGVSHLA